MNENSVMCAVDVNQYDQNLIDLAAVFAKSLDVELNLVHVTYLPGYDSESGYRGSIRPLGQIHADGELLNSIQPTESDVRVNHWQMLGAPRVRLMEAIVNHQPQMLVVGTHGRTGLKRLMLGSVAEYLLRHADCPVVVLRDQASKNEHHENPASTV